MDTWLIFFMVCFVGIVFMFYCVLRREDALLKTMRDEHAQIRLLLQALNASLDAEPGFGENRYGGYDAGSRENPISVSEALNAYARKDRLDMDETRGADKDGLPDLKF